MRIFVRLWRRLFRKKRKPWSGPPVNLDAALADALNKRVYYSPMNQPNELFYKLIKKAGDK